MKEFLINSILPLLRTGLITGVITPIVIATIRFIKTKEKEIKQRLISSGHAEELQTAKEIWHVVEEKYRVTENAFAELGAKSDYFDKLLLAKIPYIKEEDLNHLRQAVAGEFNKDKSPTVDMSTQLLNVNSQLQNLRIENEQLKAKLNQVNSVVNIQ